MKKILVIITSILCLCSCVKRTSAESGSLGNKTAITSTGAKFDVIYENTMWTVLYVNDSTFLCIPGYNNPVEGEENRPRLLQISNGHEAKEVIDEIS